MKLCAIGIAIIAGLFGRIDGTSGWTVAVQIPPETPASDDALAGKPSGALDPTFTPGTIVNGSVKSLSVLPDGKVLISGIFTGYVARLNIDGSLDSTFTPVALSFDSLSRGNSWVRKVVAQKDGKVIIGGYFSKADGVPRQGIARLNSDGSLDTSFEPGPRFAEKVESLVLQLDGRIVVVGSLWSSDGTRPVCVARLNSDGTRDSTFDAETCGFGFLIRDVTPTRDGKIVICDLNKVTRLNSDGSLDVSFAPGGGEAVAAQPDGKIVVVGGIKSPLVARHNEDGSPDLSFRPGSGFSNPPSSAVTTAVAIQPDGKILVGGAFSHFNGIPRNRIVRLMPDGSLDMLFDSGNWVAGIILAVGIDGAGNIPVAGSFHDVDGHPRWNVARLLGDVSALRLSLPTRIGSTVRFSFSSAMLGKTYSLEFKDSLPERTWTTTLELMATNLTMNVSVPAQGSISRFYRVRRLP